MNFSHIEYGRARTRGMSNTTYTTSSTNRSSRSRREEYSAGRRSEDSTSSFEAARPTPLFFDRDRSRSSTFSSSSDDEPMFHLELSSPSAPAPEAPKVTPSLKLPIFVSLRSMHASAVEILERPCKLYSAGKLTSFEPKGFDAQAPDAPEAIELVEEFGAYSVGTAQLRQALPGPVAQLNRTLRGANSLALVLLFVTGEICAGDSHQSMVSKIDAFVSAVREAQAPQRAAPCPPPPPPPRFCDLKLV